LDVTFSSNVVADVPNDFRIASSALAVTTVTISFTEAKMSVSISGESLLGAWASKSDFN
jgi:hypothetical protein